MRYGPRVSIGRMLLLALCWSCTPIASNRSASTGVPSNREVDTEVIRTTERERLRSLVDADLEVARRLHADDFQLNKPAGGSLSKEEYLGGIASGQLDYLYWESETIAVRSYGSVAVIRYKSQLEIVVRGQKISRRPYWHTDSTVANIRAGYWSTWSQQFSENAALQPPNAKPVTGRAVILAWGQAFPPVEKFSFSDVQVAGDGNMAYGARASRFGSRTLISTGIFQPDSLVLT